MSRRGRKCSMKLCTSYQHSHKHLSFFRFPKDLDRCKVWIERSDRPDLADKNGVHEDRLCELHFEREMFQNDYRNRLQPYAVPTLFLKEAPPQLKATGPKSNLTNGLIAPMGLAAKRSHASLPQQLASELDKEDLLEEITEEPIQKIQKQFKPTQQTYMHAAMAVRETGLSFRTAAEKYNVNYIALRRFCARYANLMSAVYRPPQSQSSQPPLTPIAPQPTKFKQASPPQLLPLKQSPQTMISPVVRSHQSPTVHPPPVKPFIPSPINHSPSTITSSGNSFKRPRQIFSIEQEEELSQYVRETSTFYSGLSTKDLRTLAYVFAVCHRVELPVGWMETHQASFDWCLGFIKRNKLSPMVTTQHTLKGDRSGQQASRGGGQPIPMSIKSIELPSVQNGGPIACE